MVNNTKVKNSEEIILLLYGIMNPEYLDKCYDKCRENVCLCLDVEEMNILHNILDEDTKEVLRLDDYWGDTYPQKHFPQYNYTCDVKSDLFKLIKDQAFDLDDDFTLKKTSSEFNETDFWQVLTVCYMLNSQYIISQRESLCRICLYCDCGYILLKRYLFSQMLICIDYFLKDEKNPLIDACAENLLSFFDKMKLDNKNLKENHGIIDLLIRYKYDAANSFKDNKKINIEDQLEKVDFLYPVNDKDNILSCIFESQNYYDEAEFYHICRVLVKVFEVCGYESPHKLEGIYDYIRELGNNEKEDDRYYKLYEILQKISNGNYSIKEKKDIIAKVRDYLSDYDDLSTEKLDELCQYIDDAPYNNC